MLHEILLSLSGHPSALFDSQVGHTTVPSTSGHLLSPPEAELLVSISHLSRLHRKTRDHVARIGSTHSSIVCRAVATSISSHQLVEFQRRVLEVEGRILKEDATSVGAYNIVPLAGIVHEFTDWVRLMDWLWDISIFISSPEIPKETERFDKEVTSGAALINKLRIEAQTGFPDIEEAALDLSKVAETAWLRQLSTWLLYGRLPSFGTSDFFIQQEDDGTSELSFVLLNSLLPKFVTRQTASSILFIGKSLNQIRSLSRATSQSSIQKELEFELLPRHVQHLSQVAAPIAAAVLTDVVSHIRISLSQNLLQHLLPLEQIVEALTVLHQFFLLGRGEFAMTLITQGDEMMVSRTQGFPMKSTQSSSRGLLLKEAEVNQVLARSFSNLSILSGTDDHTDDILDVATHNLRLVAGGSTRNRPGTPGRAKDADTKLPLLTDLSFDELLLSMPSTLTMDIKSPLDLLITKADLEVYASIHSFLLAIRRAHLHLAQLWRHSSVRRDHPCPPGYEFSNSEQGRAMLGRRRSRAAARTRSMRRVWATCAAAIFFLGESEAYFQGLVVHRFFDHLLSWIMGSQDTLRLPKSSVQREQHDPEAVALAHRRFLATIIHALLITDTAFTRTLRIFCTHVDELVAYITRLANIQRNLDLEEDEGVEDYTQNYRKEERMVILELDRARRRLDSDLKTLVQRLREIDSERIGATAPVLEHSIIASAGAYEPPSVGGIDRLLMKLDWESETIPEKLNNIM